MEKVLGIGGLFFRARDSKSLAEWYEKHLRHHDPTPTGLRDGAVVPGRRRHTVFAPFKEDTKYFPAREDRDVELSRQGS